MIEIVDEEIYYDFQLNNTGSTIVGTDREKVLARIPRGFEYQYNVYCRIKKEDIDTQIIKPCKIGKDYKTLL